MLRAAKIPASALNGLNFAVGDTFGQQAMAMVRHLEREQNAARSDDTVAFHTSNLAGLATSSTPQLSNRPTEHVALRDPEVHGHRVDPEDSFPPGGEDGTSGGSGTFDADDEAIEQAAIDDLVEATLAEEERGETGPASREFQRRHADARQQRDRNEKRQMYRAMLADPAAKASIARGEKQFAAALDVLDEFAVACLNQ